MKINKKKKRRKIYFFPFKKKIIKRKKLSMNASKCENRQMVKTFYVTMVIVVTYSYRYPSNNLFSKKIKK